MSEFRITPDDGGAGQQDWGIDPVKMERLIAEREAAQSLPFAILGGLMASIVGAVLWAAITAATEYQIGFMAIGVGILVGYAVNFFGKGMTTTFAIAGAVFALFGCLLGNLLTVVFMASQMEDSSALGVVAAFATSPLLVVEMMKKTFSPNDLLFYAIAVYEGYRFSMRPLTDEELASFQKGPVTVPGSQTEMVP